MNIAVHTSGRLKAPVGHSSVKGFVDGVDTVFALAERSNGFVWRFNADASPEAMAERQTYSGDQRVVITLSVWESLEQLHHYAYSTLHGKFYERGAEWFVPSEDETMVLWSVPEGVRPTLRDAKERLNHLNSNGPTKEAFGMKDAEAFV